MHATRRRPSAVAGPARSDPAAILSLGLLLVACTGGEPPREDAGSAPPGAAVGPDAAAGPDTPGAAASADSMSPASVPVELLPPLEGTEWGVEVLHGAPPPEGVHATLTLDGEARMVAGSGGCNRYTGAYELAVTSLDLLGHAGSVVRLRGR